MKFFCKPKCRHGNIFKCDVNDRFADSTTWTDEPNYKLCPRYAKEKVKK